MPLRSNDDILNPGGVAIRSRPYLCVMKRITFFAMSAALFWSACNHHYQKVTLSTPFEQYPEYSGADLGMAWTPQRSTFKLWSPPADAVQLHLYEQGTGGRPVRTLALKPHGQGVWAGEIEGDQQGKFYTVQVHINGQWLQETPDPYAKAVGVNGLRGMIVDRASTHPEGWENDRKPPLAQPNDIILYELHLRDLSVHPESGIRNKGKYLGLAETGAQNTLGQSTGLDHIAELGVTHVHLLPAFDFRYTSVDETRPDLAKYNWGYDPENYNVPEGSYSTDPYDGRVRIREFKQMVQALHSKGLRVVMDVVYNHTGATEGSVFNRVVPGYYYRQNKEGGFSNASACGNETASERAMMRRYIIESVLWWAKEYHVDGFRFDLMGIHDIETMNQVSAALHAYDPSIYIYGEGWTAGGSPLPDADRAIKANTYRLNQIAAFSDDFRDALKGSVFAHQEKGFVSGRTDQEESIKFGIVASIQHPQIDYSKVNYSKAPWSKAPDQTISYAECHDNHTLWDRLTLSCPEASEEDRIKMHKLALGMVLTAQGVPFLHAGTEFLRTKNGVENSFESPDSINQINWERKAKYIEVNEYVKGLIALRKSHPAFRLTSEAQIARHLRFHNTPPGVVAWQINGGPGGDVWSDMIVICNGSAEKQAINIPSGDWKVVTDGVKINEAGLYEVSGESVSIRGISLTILVKD